MAAFFKAETLTELSTTDPSFTSADELVFTPDDTGDVWLVFVTGTMRSSSTAEVAAEMRYTVNGTERGLWGHPFNGAGAPNGAGFLLFDRITGTVAEQTVAVEYRSADGTSYVDDLRVVAMKLPADADFQFAESLATGTTTGSDVAVLEHTWTPSGAGNYIVLGGMSHREAPGNLTSQAWVELAGDSLHPDAPSGVHHSNARDAWNPMAAVFRANLAASSQTINLRFTSSNGGVQTSGHRYRRVMAFREDAFAQIHYSEALPRATTTGASFQTRDSVAVPAPVGEREFLSLQIARIAGPNSSTTHRSGELRREGSALVRTDQTIDAPSSALLGYHHNVAVADYQSTDAAATFDSGWLSPDGASIGIAESVTLVLRPPATELGQTSVSGAASATADGVATRSALTNVSGDATATVDSGVEHGAAGALVGGTMPTPGATAVFSGMASVSGAAAAVVAAKVLHGSQVIIAGDAQIVPYGSVVFGGTSLVSGTASVVAPAKVSHVADASVVGAALAQSASGVTHCGAAFVAGDALASGTFGSGILRARALARTNSLNSGLGQILNISSALVQGIANMSARGGLTSPATASVTGDASNTGNGVIVLLATASVQGAAAATTAAKVTHSAIAMAAGDTELTTASEVVHLGAAVMLGDAGVVAASKVARPGVASVAGAAAIGLVAACWCQAMRPLLALLALPGSPVSPTRHRACWLAMLLWCRRPAATTISRLCS